MNKFTVPFLASVCITGSAFAQGGDDCTVPTPLSAFGTVGFDTTAATTSDFNGGGACDNGSGTINQDLFWAFTAPATGDYQFDTDGSTFDTKISVHFGGDCAATCAVYDDDAGAGLQSLAQLNGVTAGDVLLIQVGGFGGGNGTGLLNITQIVDPCSSSADDSFEDNDSCLTAVPLALGSYSGLFVTTGDQDYFRVTVPANEILTATVTNTSGPSTDVAIYDASCMALVTGGFNGNDFSTVGATTATDLIVGVVVDPSATANCTTYDLELSAAPDPCVSGIDDAFEDNDTCQTAVPIAVGSYIDLYASNTDSDFYSFTIQPDEILDFTCSNDLNADVDLNLFDAGCNLLQTFNADALTAGNPGGATPLTVIIEVFVDSTSAENCTNYDLDVTTMDDPCALGADMFEDNDDCAGAVALGDGFYPGLTVFESDNDYFAVGVDPGATMTADIFFLDATADVDLYLWDPAIDCDTNVATTGGAWLAQGFSVTDDESISYTNNTGAPQSLILEIDMFTAGGCNTYDLQVAGLNGMGGGPGVGYCPGNPNSTGMPSEISASGSRVVSNNDLTLTATDLPPLVFGFFIVSRLQGLVMNPAGSAGNLCLSGAIGRYVGPGQIMNSGLAGEISLTLDLTAIPQPLGFEAVMSGDQWNFQLWHRDAGSTSNFTNGVQVDFI
jgi:hypothetical protein